MNKLLLVLSLIFSVFSFAFQSGAQTNQTVSNGESTTGVSFQGSGCVYNWVNSTPGIGLAASGTGDIRSFAAVNTGTLPVTATITATPAPNGFAYIANNGYGANSVSVIDIANRSIATTIPVGSNPYCVAVNHKGTIAYVGNTSGNISGITSISVINTVTNLVTATIPLNGEAGSMVLSLDDNTLYVASYPYITVINTATNSIITSFTEGGNFYETGLVLSPDGSRLYISDGADNDILVINTANYSKVADIIAGYNPYGIALNPDGSRLYVTTSVQNNLVVVNTANDAIIATIPVGQQPTDVVLNDDGSRAYVVNGNSNTVSVINTATNSVISTIQVGLGPIGLSLTTDGKELFVVNVRSNNVSVINTATNTVIAEIATGLNPVSYGNFITPNLNCSPITFTITVNPTSIAPAIIAGTVTGNISACVGSASVNPNVEQFKVSGSNLSGNITATAPAGFEISLSAASGYANSVTIPQSGFVTGAIVYIRSAATAPTGSISGAIVLASSGATSQNITVTGLVKALPTTNPVSNQIVTAGNKTTAINFTGSAGAYNWINNTPGIGLPANGTGNIASFTAVNTGTTPITATISVSPAPSALAYIANYDSNDVSVISTITNTVITTIPVGSNPFGVSVSQDGNLVYITNKGSNSVSVINTSTNTVTATINVGSGPQGIIVSPDGTRVYVANSADNSISVINTANNTVLVTIPVGQAPYGVTITPDGSKVYVANYSSNTVSVINSLSASVTATIVGFTNPLGVAVSPDGSMLYVSNFGSNTIKIINTTSNTITSSIQTMLGPNGLVVSPDGSKVYLATSGGYFTTVFLSDNTSNSVAFDSGRSISVTPDGSYVYIANGYNVDWVSTSDYTKGGQIAVGTHPISFGNFISKAPGCIGSPITFTITVNPPPPTITAGNATGNISACAGSASSSPNILQFIVSGSGLSANITATAPPGFEISLAAATGYSNSVTIPQSGGTASNTVVYVRSTPSASGSISGNVVLSSSGAINQEVAVNATVNALPIVNAVVNQTVNNGAATTAINFTGTGNTFNWTNDLPGIGLLSSGTGSIPSFTAVNTGNRPVTATITVTLDSQISGFAYAANFGSNSVSVINTATNKVVANVTVGSNPNNAAVTPDGKQVYVTNPNSYDVSVINTATNTVTTTIPVGVIPFDVVISPDNKYAYVVNQGSNSVSVISTLTNTVIFTIPVGFDPYHIAISPDGSKLYITYGQNGSTLSVINTATYAIIADIPIGFNFYGVTASPDGKTVYVGNRLTGEISVISTSTNSVVTAFLINGSAGGVVVSPDGSRLYIANEGQGTVTVVNTATNTVLSDISGSDGPYGISISPDGSRVYVTNPGGGDVTVINTATSTLVSRIDVGQLPESFNNFVSGTSGCSGIPVTFTITVNPTLPPKIVATGTLSALTTTYGTHSASISFAVSGTDLTAGILVTPPPGFEVSTDNVTFSSIVTVGSAGTISSTTVYVRLKSTTPVGSYSGDIVLTSSNAANVNVATATSTVNPAPLTITLDNVTKTYGTALNSGTGSTAFTPTGLKNKETIGSITVTYGPGAAANATAITYTGSVTGSAATGGTFTAGNYTITYLPGDIIVNPAQLIITANNQTITFGEPIPALTVTYNSFVNGETVAQLTTPPVITTTATSSSAPGTYTIEVNGATSPNYTITQVAGTLTIKPFNPPIVIPNTFTPNGDGINDVWNIKSLSDYPDCSVSIYTRYGSLIYQSHGYPKPWDGTFKGSALPTGTYYYIINLQNGNEPQSGPVTIIR